MTDLDKAIMHERMRCSAIALEWTKAKHIRLHAGEMTAQEMRSVKAVTNAIVRAIQAG